MAETMSVSPTSDSFILLGSEQMISLEPGNYEHPLPTNGSIPEFEHDLTCLVGLLDENMMRNSVSQAQLGRSPVDRLFDDLFTGTAFESEMTTWLNSDDLKVNLNSNSFQSSMMIPPY